MCRCASTTASGDDSLEYGAGADTAPAYAPREQRGDGPHHRARGDGDRAGDSPLPLEFQLSMTVRAQARLTVAEVWVLPAQLRRMV
jgi:hypothetical protein